MSLPPQAESPASRPRKACGQCAAPKRNNAISSPQAPLFIASAAARMPAHFGVRLLAAAFAPCGGPPALPRASPRRTVAARTPQAGPPARGEDHKRPPATYPSGTRAKTHQRIPDEPAFPPAGRPAGSGSVVHQPNLFRLCAPPGRRSVVPGKARGNDARLSPHPGGVARTSRMRHWGVRLVSAQHRLAPVGRREDSQGPPNRGAPPAFRPGGASGR